MPKYPSEIFGYPYYNRSEEAEKVRGDHSKDEFIGVLQAKIEAEMHLKLDLNRGGERKSLDIKPPTSTGRLRDRQDDQLSLFEKIE